LHGHNKPKYGKHDIAFQGMLTCAHDNCTVTAELKKNKYVYYRCTGHRGPCELPRFREQEIAEKLAHVLQDVCIPEEVAQSIGASLQQVHAQMQTQAAQERARLERELAALYSRVDAAFLDRLDGKIITEVWEHKQAGLQGEELRIKSLIEGPADNRSRERLLSLRKILELAQNAYNPYLARNAEEQADLLRNVLSVCSIDTVGLCPKHRNPLTSSINGQNVKNGRGERI